MPRLPRSAGNRSAQPSGSRPGCAFFWLLFFAQAKKSDPRKARKPWTCRRNRLPSITTAAAAHSSPLWNQQHGFHSPLRVERVTFSLLVQRKSNQKESTAGDAIRPLRGRYPALLAAVGDGPQLAALRHAGLFAPAAAAMLRSLYRQRRSKAGSQRQRQRRGRQQLHPQLQRRDAGVPLASSLHPPTHDP